MDREKIHKLLIASANGWASQAEFEQLEAALLDDSSLREMAAEWLIDESLLHSEAAYLSAFQASAHVQARKALSTQTTHAAATPGKSSKSWWLVAGAGALACSLLVNVWQLQTPSNDGPRMAVYQPEGARLIRATGCVWESTDGSVQPDLGKFLGRGETVKLIEGIAEFEAKHAGYSTRVRLQGPVVVELGSNGMPTVRSGRMVAHVTLYGEPLTWRSPLGPVEIVESASIGVDVSQRSAAVHVLDGMIRFAPIDAEGLNDINYRRPSWEEYHEGEAIQVRLAGADPGGPERIAADSSIFAEEQSMATDQLQLGSAYAKLVLDSQPSGYWRFEESVSDSAGLLQNEVAGRLALKVIGSVTRVRQGDNHALEFGMTKESGWLLSQELWPAEPLDSYTLECWFKPSHYHNGAIFSVVNPEQTEEKRNANAILVEIGGPHNLSARHTHSNAIRFVNRSPAMFGIELGQACQADDYVVREWQHLAAVKEGEDLRLHLNGDVVATATDDRPVPPQMRLVIGQIFTQRAERPFVGQLDEVVIYEHALSKEEIATHYRVGSISPKDKKAI